MRTLQKRERRCEACRPIQWRRFSCLLLWAKSFFRPGFGALAHFWDGKCELVARRATSYKSFQELRDNLAKLKVKNAIIDGELVCLDTEGRSIFNELHTARVPNVLRVRSAVSQRARSEAASALRSGFSQCGVSAESGGRFAKRKTGTYATVSGWLKIKNPNYTQSERRHELFDSFKAKATNTTKLPPVLKKSPLRTVPVPIKKTGKSRRARSSRAVVKLGPY